LFTRSSKRREHRVRKLHNHAMNEHESSHVNES
jgi:hypothetical protein